MSWKTVGAMIYGDNIDDHEPVDEKLLGQYKDVRKGFTVEIMGLERISEIINKGDFDILVMGNPRSYWFQRFTFGTTVDKLRHKISIPLFIVKKNYLSLFRYALYLYFLKKIKDVAIIGAKKNIKMTLSEENYLKGIIISVVFQLEVSTNAIAEMMDTKRLLRN
jgi:hypothetical protein